MSACDGEQVGEFETIEVGECIIDSQSKSSANAVCKPFFTGYRLSSVVFNSSESSKFSRFFTSHAFLSSCLCFFPCLCCSNWLKLTHETVKKYTKKLW